MIVDLSRVSLCLPTRMEEFTATGLSTEAPERPVASPGAAVIGVPEDGAEADRLESGGVDATADRRAGGGEGADAGAEAGRLNPGGVDAVADRGPGGDEGADVGAGAGGLESCGAGAAAGCAGGEVEGGVEAPCARAEGSAASVEGRRARAEDLAARLLQRVSHRQRARKVGSMASHARFCQFVWQRRKQARCRWVWRPVAKFRCRGGRDLASEAELEAQRARAAGVLAWYAQYVYLLRRLRSGQPLSVIHGCSGGGGAAEGTRRVGGSPVCVYRHGGYAQLSA